MMIIYYLFIPPALGSWCWSDGFCPSLSWPVESWSWLTWFRFDASINKCQIYSEDLVLLSPDCSRGGPLSVVKNITFQQQFFLPEMPKILHWGPHPSLLMVTDQYITTHIAFHSTNATLMRIWGNWGTPLEGILRSHGLAWIKNIHYHHCHDPFFMLGYNRSSCPGLGQWPAEYLV